VGCPATNWRRVFLVTEQRTGTREVFSNNYFNLKI
jgi:hypothetical protein